MVKSGSALAVTPPSADLGGQVDLDAVAVEHDRGEDQLHAEILVVERDVVVAVEGADGHLAAGEEAGADARERREVRVGEGADEALGLERVDGDVRLMPPPEMTLAMKAEKVAASAAGLQRIAAEGVGLVPPVWPAQSMPSSRPASRWASRMRTSRLTCWPPVRVMVLMTAGLPNWPTMASTFCIESASGTVPESWMRPLTVETLTLEPGTPARIAREMAPVSAPTSTASRPTGVPAAE